MEDPVDAADHAQEDEGQQRGHADAVGELVEEDAGNDDQSCKQQYDFHGTCPPLFPMSRQATARQILQRDLPAFKLRANGETEIRHCKHYIKDEAERQAAPKCARGRLFASGLSPAGNTCVGTDSFKRIDIAPRGLSL